MYTEIIIFFIVASVIGYLIQNLSVRNTRISKEKIKSFARIKNWQYRHVPGKSNTGEHIYLSNYTNEWKIDIYSFISTSVVTNSVHKEQWIEWSTNKGQLKNGIAVLGPRLPQKTIKMLNKGKAGIFTNIIKRLMFQYTQGMSIDLNHCKLVESSVEETLGAVLASEGNENALDQYKTLNSLITARKSKNIMYHPIIIRDTEGIRVRIRGKLNQLKQLEQLYHIGVEITDRNLK